jgi:hypothetical protein
MDWSQTAAPTRTACRRISIAFWATAVLIEAIQARRIRTTQRSSTAPSRASSRDSAAELLTTGLQVMASAKAPPSRLSSSTASRCRGDT